ncbi:MAG: LytTR family transcriptional regulator DNA-binding domain-containing protein [Reichenbachiella sp.]
MSIRVAVIEDNPITSQDLQEILAENGMQVCGSYYSAEDALKGIPQQIPDILLVDIKLKGELSGIDLATQLEGEFPIIYLTSNSDKETVAKALKTQPASFLTKPFDTKDVLIAIELAVNNYSENHSIENKTYLPFIFLKEKEIFEKVPVDNILYLEADGSYCKFVTSEKEYLLTGNLNHICQQLNPQTFKRIHRSYTININQITGLDNDYVFFDKLNLPIGRTYKAELKTILKRFS